MTLQEIVIQNIIRRLFRGEDYRTEILALINAEFLQYAIDFFRKVANAKLNNETITGDWYKREFLSGTLSSKDIIIHSGLNEKTIMNMYNSRSRPIVIDVTNTYYDELYESIMALAEKNHDIDLMLTIKLRGVAVDLNISESLIVINSLAVKRHALSGGAWSTAGKQVEIPLMLSLCNYFSVPGTHYMAKGLSTAGREVDFHLIAKDGKQYFCEVKLMGRGNPESADVVIARDSHIFIADKLSNLNKQQLKQRGLQWLELRSENGYRKFLNILQELNIPCVDFMGNKDERLNEILESLFK